MRDSTFGDCESEIDRGIGGISAESNRNKGNIVMKWMMAAALAVMVMLGDAATWAGESTPAGPVLWYEKPAKVWGVETLPLGNGRMGAMIFGGMQKEQIQFNENSLWIGDELDTGAYQNFGDLFLEFSHPNGTGYRRELDLARAVHTIIYTSGGVVYKREYFASHPAGVIVLRFTADKPGAYSGTLSLTDAHEATMTAAERRITASGSLAKAAALGSKSVGSMAGSTFGAKDRPYTIALAYEAQALLQPEGGTVEAKDGKLVFSNVNAMTVFLAAGTDFVMDHAKGWRGEHPHAALVARLERAEATPYVTLLNEHIQDYQKLFGRLRLDLGESADTVRQLPTDRRMEAHRRVEASDKTPGHAASVDPELEALLYQYARYLMISCSRSGGIPANLQGLWNAKNAPIWRSDYHSDVNLQENYWFVDQANLTGCFEPLSEWIWSILPAKRASTQWLWSVSVKGKVKEFPPKPEPGSKASQIRGFVFTSENGLFGGGSYKFVPGDAAWLAQNIWDHYAFTQDRSYLETRAYPIMKELCEFWEDQLKERGGPLTDSTGSPQADSTGSPQAGSGQAKLVSPVSHSPEHGGDAEGNSYEQQLVHELFTNYIEAAKVLGKDEEFRKKVESMRGRLLGPQIGKWGQLQEWAKDIDNPKDNHRHTSHLLAVFPGRQITPTSTPELAKAASVSLEARGPAEATDSGPCEWVWVVRGATWARLAEAEKAYQCLAGLFSYNLWPSGLTFLGKYLQVDGNFGYAAAVGEMLIQSHEQDAEGLRIVRLLPALPKAWPTGSVKGICARGGFTVDMTWKDGKVTDYRVTSPEPKKVRVQIGTESKVIQSGAMTEQ